MENDISKKIKLLRVSYGLTQADVANKIGISQQRYSTYEAKVCSLDSDVLIKICKLYGVSADYLLGIEQTNDTNNNIELSSVTDKQLEKIVEKVVSIVKKG